MYAYIDETGNTGPNLFDKSQPVFMSGALITRGDFDVLFTRRISALAKQLGCDEIHASEIGLEKIEEIAPELLSVLLNGHIKTGH
jgi:hypothetical protein